MIVLVDVDPLMRLSLATLFEGNAPVTVSHGFPPESTFPSQEHHTAWSHVPNCSFLLAFVAPNL